MPSSATIYTTIKLYYSYGTSVHVVIGIRGNVILKNPKTAGAMTVPCRACTVC